MILVKMSRSRSSSTDSDSAHSESSGPASPAAPPCPPLSATKVNVCFDCGEQPAEYRVDDGDGAAGIWACRECRFAMCEHCEEAAKLGKAAVCGCMPIKSKCKRAKPNTPPATPTVYMDESE